MYEWIVTRKPNTNYEVKGRPKRNMKANRKKNISRGEINKKKSPSFAEKKYKIKKKSSNKTIYLSYQID